MCFFTGSTLKTVDDHCGYALPWDPLQHITSNNAGYHDVHHQSWGIKTNFSQPFFTFWDRVLGTVWTGGDVSSRYERARVAAQRKLDRDSKAPSANDSAPITGSRPIDSILDDAAPYDADAANATHIDAATQAHLRPSVPAGKAAAQALASREQILQDRAAGGPSVIAEEMAEEANVKRHVRLSSTPKLSPAPATGSLKGLRDRVSASGSCVLGYESTR